MIEGYERISPQTREQTNNSELSAGLGEKWAESRTHAAPKIGGVGVKSGSYLPAVQKRTSERGGRRGGGA